MRKPQTYVSKPTEVRALEWTGDNELALHAFTRDRFFKLTEQERRDSDDPQCTAQVWDYSTWVLVKTGQWIIEGTKGEFYPCDAEVFAAEYDLVEEE